MKTKEELFSHEKVGKKEEQKKTRISWLTEHEIENNKNIEENFEKEENEKKKKNSEHNIAQFFYCIGLKFFVFRLSKSFQKEIRVLQKTYGIRKTNKSPIKKC